MVTKNITRDLLKFLEEATSPYHTVVAAASILDTAGFMELRADETWKLQTGGKYFVRIYDSSLVAFRIGAVPRGGIHVAASHTDFPCLRVKPAAAISQNKYGKINVEIYGGMIRSSWVDRPLSLAGKLVLRGKDPFHPVVKVVDARRPLMTIPHLAIHMNRQMNEGLELNPQKDMLPLMTMLSDGENNGEFFLDFLASEFDCDKQDILSYELTVYPTETGCLMGLKNEFISSPRLDNLTSVKACLSGIIRGKRKEGLQVAALFDNEEVGSHTKQGAGSLVLPQLLQRIYTALGFSLEDYLVDVQKGFMLSLDVAHAMHPNVPEKNDITNFPVLNGGVALKIACSQAYAGDAEAIAIVTALCQDGEIPYQYFVNRSDIKGGSTLGSILSANLPMRAMDIGVPILAMHSARETMGVYDQEALESLLYKFFS
jgi:aspartyl aminopeptidase